MKHVYFNVFNFAFQQLCEFYWLSYIKPDARSLTQHGSIASKVLYCSRFWIYANIYAYLHTHSYVQLDIGLNLCPETPKQQPIASVLMQQKAFDVTTTTVHLFIRSLMPLWNGRTATLVIVTKGKPKPTWTTNNDKIGLIYVYNANVTILGVRAKLTLAAS